MATIDGGCDENTKVCDDGGVASLNGDDAGDGLTAVNGAPGVVAILNCDPEEGCGEGGMGIGGRAGLVGLL